MTQKEKLLQMKSYEEFDRNRELFKGMKPDKDIIEHLSRITPKSPNPQEELYKIPRSEGGSIGNCLESKGGENVEKRVSLVLLLQAIFPNAYREFLNSF